MLLKLWRCVSGSVELHLLKSEAGMWSTFIPSDHRGRVILDAQQLEDLLKPFTSDSLVRFLLLCYK